MPNVYHSLRIAHPGQVLVVAALTLSALLAFTALLLNAGFFLVERRGLQNAADAAALAAAAAQWPLRDTDEEPSDAARSVAEANGATLDACECERNGDHATVSVSRATRIRMLGVAPRRVSATARARIDLDAVFRSRAE